MASKKRKNKFITCIALFLLGVFGFCFGVWFLHFITPNACCCSGWAGPEVCHAPWGPLWLLVLSGVSVSMLCILLWIYLNNKVLKLMPITIFVLCYIFCVWWAFVVLPTECMQIMC